jgi:hypothetical protein
MFEKIKNIFLKILVVITFAILVPLMMTGQAGCPTGCETGQPTICGNGICESGENNLNCPADCVW